MNFPLDLTAINLWLGFTAIILLGTSEIILSYRGDLNILLNKQKFRKVGLMVGSIFIFTIIIQIYQILST